MKAIRRFLTHTLVWPFTSMVLCAIFPMLPIALLYKALGIVGDTAYSSLTLLYAIAWWQYQRRPGDSEPEN